MRERSRGGRKPRAPPALQALQEMEGTPGRSGARVRARHQACEYVELGSPAEYRANAHIHTEDLSDGSGSMRGVEAGEERRNCNRDQEYDKHHWWYRSSSTSYTGSTTSCKVGSGEHSDRHGNRCQVRIHALHVPGTLDTLKKTPNSLSCALVTRQSGQQEEQPSSASSCSSCLRFWWWL